MSPGGKPVLKASRPLSVATGKPAADRLGGFSVSAKDSAAVAGKVRSEIEWLKRGFSILRIFTDFRMPRLPMDKHTGAGQRELSHCQREEIWRRSRPSSLWTAGRLKQPVRWSEARPACRELGTTASFDRIG